MKALFVVLAFSLLLPGCASVPVRSPAATLAFQNTQVIQALDLIRDFAIAANAETPPLISTETTRYIVTFNETAISVINAVPGGWKAAVTAGLDTLVKTFSSAEQKLLQPYVTIIETVLNGVLA